MRYHEIKLMESPKRIFYHGSKHEFPKGYLLTPQADGYVHAVAGDEFDAQIRITESILEEQRPEHMISRLGAVFITDNKSYALNYGKFVYRVMPVGKYERSCLWWYIQIENWSAHHVLGGEPLDKQEGIEYAKRYWADDPAPAGEIWQYEFRCHAARIVR